MKAIDYYGKYHDRLLNGDGTCRISGGALMEWISVKDRLPDAFCPVIVYRKGRVEQGARDVNGWWKVYGTRTKSVTHWMPLPEPPSEEIAIGKWNRRNSLQEREERNKGCLNCTAGDGEYTVLLDKWGEEDFCPMCGRPLKGEQDENG